ALREAIAAYLRTSRGVRCDAGQVFIVSGSQQALDLSARVLLDAGDARVGRGARLLARASRARGAGLPDRGRARRQRRAERRGGYEARREGAGRVRGAFAPVAA